ncbi:MAG: metal-dependent hydrolase [Anaerolineales bacterium]|nr:metal-dependent hydrolase [Anaerolineales bacterium]
MSDKYTFLGHGVHQIDTGGQTLLIDPFLTNNPQAAIRADQANPDFIFVSHGHGDHVGDTVEIAKRTSALVICNAEIAGWLGNKGVTAHGQHIGGGYHHPFGYLKLTIAFHGSGLPDGANGGNPAGMHLTTNTGKKIYIACDTGLFSDMALYGEGGLDLAVLPIGDNYTMGPNDALKAVKLLKPKHVVPCHYNTWPPIAQDAEAWAARVRTETDAQVHVLKPGESLDL